MWPLRVIIDSLNLKAAIAEGLERQRQLRLYPNSPGSTPTASSVRLVVTRDGLQVIPNDEK